MSVVLVDTNVLLDIFTEDPTWYVWSSSALAKCAESESLAINPIIYAEVSVRFERVEDLEEVLPLHDFKRLPLPWEAAFLAGKSFLTYQRRGGTKRAPLPDFYIGAHAAVSGLSLLTSDAARYRTYFPKLKIVAPKE